MSIAAPDAAISTKPARVLTLPLSRAVPRCGEEARRILYPPPILFKTSGFYVTDNRKGSSYSPPSEQVKSVTAADASKKSEPDKPGASVDKSPEAAAAG